MTTTVSLRTPFVLWLTGLPCSGKSTIARALIEALKPLPIEWLDGDSLRNAIGNFHFDDSSRALHLRMVAYCAARLESHGVSVVASFVSPTASMREFARNSCQNFVEVFCDAPISVCEARDVKGMYAKARRGEITGFTGVDAPFERPAAPELVLDTESKTVAECVLEILQYLKQREVK